MGAETDQRILKLFDGATYKARNKKYVNVDKRIKDSLENYEVYREIFK